MQHPGTYQTRVLQYAQVDRVVGDAALSEYAAVYSVWWSVSCSRRWRPASLRRG